MKKIWKTLKDWFTGDWYRRCSSVGGQAVMEGVMMQGSKCIAVSVRQKDGKIVMRTKPHRRLSEKHRWLGYPIIRGIVNFCVMLYTGVKILTDSAEMLGEEPEEPSKFEKKVAAALHMKPEDVMMLCAVILAVILAIGMFFVLPIGLETLIKMALPEQDLVVNLLGGLIRICVFLGYILAVSQLKEIRRVFQYHGAEHKAVYCYENNLPLTVENAQKFPTLHPRCGTSFLVIVFLISILIFTFLGTNSSNVLARVGSRLALLPVVAGVSYEVLQTLARLPRNRLVRALMWPGLMMQKITTKQPDDSMVEVAIHSLKAAEGILEKDALEASLFDAQKQPAPAPACENDA